MFVCLSVTSVCHKICMFERLSVTKFVCSNICLSVTKFVCSNIYCLSIRVLCKYVRTELHLRTFTFEQPEGRVKAAEGGQFASILELKRL